MEYRIFGPFELPRKKKWPKKRDDIEDQTDDDSSLDLRTKEALNPFWENIDKTTGHELSKGRGCYVFATRAGAGYRPWYVGQSKREFKDEVFDPSKRKTYHNVMANKNVGSPQLFLVARLTDGQKVSKMKLAPREANFVEQLLIIYAKTKNPDVRNVQKTKIVEKMVIPGIFGGSMAPNRLNKSAKELRKALGVS